MSLWLAQTWLNAHVFSCRKVVCFPPSWHLQVHHGHSLLIWIWLGLSAIRLPTFSVQNEIWAASIPSQQWVVCASSLRLVCWCLQSMRTGTSVYLFYTPPGMILQCTSKLLNVGVQCKVLRRSYSASSPCSQVSIRYPQYCKFSPKRVLVVEPNLESGANIDCCKLYRDNRTEYERLVRESIKEQLGIWTH